jgi:hypothetical protein
VKAQIAFPRSVHRAVDDAGRGTHFQELADYPRGGTGISTLAHRFASATSEMPNSAATSVIGFDQTKSVERLPGHGEAVDWHDDACSWKTRLITRSTTP